MRPGSPAFDRFPLQTAYPPGCAVLPCAPWVCLALLLAGCGRAVYRANLVFANGGEAETLDPALMTAQLDMRLAYALFEGLTTYDAAGQPRPGVAESWEISPDALTYTFHLRADACWSNGERVTAQDFVNSWRRTLTPATAARNSYQLYYLKNGQRFNDPASGLTDFSQVGVHALDDRTLRVQLEHPTPFFLDLCCTSTLLPVPLATVQRWGDAWTKPTHIVTNGAFTLQEWRLNDRMRLRKNPRYWNRDGRAPANGRRPAHQPGERGAQLLRQRRVRPADGQGAGAGDADRRPAAQTLFSFRAVPGDVFYSFQLLAPAVQRSARAAGVFARGG